VRYGTFERTKVRGSSAAERETGQPQDGARRRHRDFNAVVRQQKLALLQTIQFPLDQQSGNVPAIASLSRTASLPGSTVVINDSNFGTTQGTSVVRLNTTNATVTPLSASQTAVTVR